MLIVNRHLNYAMPKYQTENANLHLLNVSVLIAMSLRFITIPGHFTTDCPGIEKYRFYLAFENSLCSEYITEKLWWNAYQKVVNTHILKLQIIPQNIQVLRPNSAGRTV